MRYIKGLSRETSSLLKRIYQQFIFFGGILAQETISEIEIATDEISAYQFLPPKQALTLVSNKLARRVNKCLTISDRDEMLYLEDQEEV